MEILSGIVFYPLPFMTIAPTPTKVRIMYKSRWVMIYDVATKKYIEQELGIVRQKEVQ